jgi:hypothetical protein
MKVKDNCWICEGWSELKFDLRCKTLGADINIHFDFDDYRPERLMPANAGFYNTYRMVPPGIHRYLYTVNGECFVNPYANQIELEPKHADNIRRSLNTQNFYIKTCNFISVKHNSVPWVDKETYDVLIRNCYPRP